MAPAEIPEWKTIDNPVGSWLNRVGETVGNSPRPTETATTRMLVLLNFTRLRVRMPLAATIPNSATPAPPRTACGMPSTIPPSLGMRPSTISTAPAKVATKRDLTPVKETRPTFWAKAVYGKVLKMPPSTVDSPSARSPSAS